MKQSKLNLSQKSLSDEIIEISSLEDTSKSSQKENIIKRRRVIDDDEKITPAAALLLEKFFTWIFIHYLDVLKQHGNF